MIPFDVAGDLVETIIKESQLIGRLLDLLSQHLSTEELNELNEEVSPILNHVEEIGLGEYDG